MESQIKTILLLGVLSVILIFIGGLFGGRTGIMFALILSLGMNIFSYFFSDKLALSMSGAQELKPGELPEVRQMVQELSHQIGIPMPRLYVTPDMQANAFATGRGPGHASVAVTQGILQVLSRDELRGVLAHELAHVKNRDILVATIASVIAGAVSSIANMAMWSGMMGGGSDDEESGTNPIVAMAAMIVVPIAAMLVQFAISRQREFGADETGAKTIGDGRPLAKALVAIHHSASRFPMQTNPGMSSLYIGNPMGSFGQGMMKLLSTHPPVEERVKRLEKIR